MTACSSGALLTRTSFVDKPRRVYVPVPPQFTAPTPAPTAPVPACTSPKTAKPVRCNRQLLDWIDEWALALGKANADKASIQSVSAQAVERTQ